MAKSGRAEGLVLTVAGMAAAAAAKKAIDVVWVAATGRRTPKPDDPDEPVGRAVAGAVVTGAVISLVRMGITRKAATRKKATA
jgi:Protein of unknown function (DUF4235)